MRNMLGLGFIFSAMDKGVRSFLRGTSNDFDKMGGAMKGAEKAAGEPGKKGLSGAMSRMGEGLKLMGLGTAIDGLHTLANKTGEVADNAHGAFKNFETFLAELKFTTGVKGADELRNKILGVSNATAASTDELAKASQILIQQGVSIEDVSKGMERIGKLTGVLGMDSETVATAMAGWNKQLGGSVQDFEKVTDQAFYLQKQMKLVGFGKQFPEMVEKTLELKNSMNLTQSQAKSLNMGMMKLSAGFQKAGLGPDQAKAATMEFTDSLMGARNEFENVRAGLAEDLGGLHDLSIVTGNVQKAFDAIKAGDPSTAFTSLGSAIDSVKAQGGDTSVMFQRLKKVFGENSQVLSMLSSRYGEVSGGINEATAALADQSGASEKGKKAFNDLTKATMSTLSFQEKLYEQNKENLGILMKLATSKFAQKIFSAMTKGLQKMMNLFEKGWGVVEPVLTKIFNALEPVIAAVFSFVGVLGGAIGVVLAGFGALTLFSGALSFVSGLITPILSGLASFAGGVISFIVSPIGLAVAAIGGLIAIGYSMTKSSESVASKVESIWGGLTSFISNAFTKMVDFLGPKLSSLFDGVPGIFEKAVKYFVLGFQVVAGVAMKAVSKLPEVFRKMSEIVVSVFGKMVDSVVGIFGKMSNVIPTVIAVTKKIGMAIADTVAMALRALPGLMSSAWKVVIDVTKKSLSGLGSILVGIFNELPKMLAGSVDMIADMFVSVGKGIIDGVIGLADAIPGALNDLINGAMSLMDDLGPKLGSMAMSTVDAAIAGLGALWKKMPAILGMLWDGLMKGIAAIARNLPKILGSLVGLVLKSVVYIVKNLPGILMGAIKIMAKVGMFLGEVLADSIKSIPNLLVALWDGVITVGKGLWDGIVGFFKEVWSAVEEVFRSFWNGSISEKLIGWWSSYLEIGKGIWNGLTGFFSDLWGGIGGIFSSSWAKIKQTSTDVANAVSEGIGGAFTGIEAGVSDVAKKFDGFGKKAGESFDVLSDYMGGSGVVEGIQELGKAMYELDFRGLMNSLDKIGTFFKRSDFAKKVTEIKNSIVSLIDRLRTSFNFQGVIASFKGVFEFLKNNPLSQGIRGVMDSIGAMAKEFMAKSPLEMIKNAFGKLSSYMSKLNFAEGFYQISNAISDLVKAAKDFMGFDTLIKGFEKLMSALSKIELPKSVEKAFDVMGSFADKVGLSGLFGGGDAKKTAVPVMGSKDDTQPVATASSTMGRNVASGGMKPDRTQATKTGMAGPLAPITPAAPQPQQEVNVSVFLKGDVRKIVQEVIVEMQRQAGRGGLAGVLSK